MPPYSWSLSYCVQIICIYLDVLYSFNLNELAIVLLTSSIAPFGEVDRN